MFPFAALSHRNSSQTWEWNCCEANYCNKETDIPNSDRESSHPIHHLEGQDIDKSVPCNKGQDNAESKEKGPRQKCWQNHLLRWNSMP